MSAEPREIVIKVVELPDAPWWEVVSVEGEDVADLPGDDVACIAEALVTWGASQ